MLALISLLLLSAPVLWGLNRLKVRYIFGWFWSILVCALVWGGILIFQLRDFPDPLTSRIFPLWMWRTGSELSLLLDAASGPFALALAGLGLAVVLTSAQRMADSPPGSAPDNPPLLQSEDWRNQAAILWLMGLGFLGALAGNPLTLLLAWAAGDLSGLWVLLLRITSREASERIVLDFSARVAGILLLMWAIVVARAEG
ncbi:MAG TPA: hypothetical protein PK530_22895, partial [Anaerolineales bacterium]|nr:hypothetical protein [Anaerolineales bacterium]